MNKEELKNQIFNEDIVLFLNKIDDNLFNLIITSPPYFGCRKYGDETLGREESPLDYIKNISEIFNKLKSKLKDDGSLFLNIGDVYFGSKGFSRNKGSWERKTDQHYSKHKIIKEDGKYLQHKQLLMLPTRIAIEMQNFGWILRNNIIWEKPNPIPSFSEDRKLPVYENIFHFVKSKKYFYNYELSKKFEHHRDVIKCGIEAYDEHQATFPEKLIYPFIQYASQPGDFIFDPFVGSGTVASVCIKSNRIFCGTELIKNNCDIIENRIKKAKEESYNIFNYDR